MGVNIYYIANYCHDFAERNLHVQPSAVTKASYILRALQEAGFSPIVYSTAELSVQAKTSMDSILIENNNLKIYYPKVVCRNNLVRKILSRLLSIYQLIVFLLFSVRKDDIVLVYHSLQFSAIIKHISFLKQFRLVFEVEEIYNAAYRSANKKIKREINILKNADGYIYVNDIISRKTGLGGPCAVCYGKYSIKSNIRTTAYQEGHHIHVVYAGALGEDSLLAIEAAKYLPAEYHLHILGYGSEEIVKSHVDYINQNIGINSARVSYDGCLFGEEYEAFLASCQIALCPRKLENDYSDYTFPSKLLVYLSYNMRTVCTPIKCIQDSKISDLITFADDISPESVAKAIMRVSLKEEFNAQDTLRNLHRSLVSDFKTLFNESITN